MPAAKRFTLYGSWLSGPSYKVGLMLSLSGQAFTYKAIDLTKGEHKSADYLLVNRYGQVPALAYGGGTMVQSNVILDYLSEFTGKFRGANPGVTWRAKEWLAWEADRLAPGIYRTRFFSRFAPSTDPAVQKVYRDAGEAALKVLDAALGKTRWLAGAEPTIADVACFAPVAFLEEAKFAVDDFPQVKAWAERLAALPGFKLPYDLMPKADVA